MRLHYFRHANFGDAPLNEWLWPRLLPGLLEGDGRRLLVGVGSLLNDGLPRAPLKAIVGAGAGYGAALPPVDATWRVYFVRGPLTAHALGLDDNLAVTDSAALVRAVPPPPPAGPRRAVAYMPHWYSAENGDWRAVCAQAGLHYIDPLAGVEAVLADLQTTDLLITEALHGAIVADALRVPWVAVRAYKHILEFKWLDWCQSLRLEYRPHRLRPLYDAAAVRRWLDRQRLVRAPGLRVRLAQPATRAGAWVHQAWVEHNARALRRVAREARPTLSDTARLEAATHRMLDKLERLRGDYASGRLN